MPRTKVTPTFEHLESRIHCSAGDFDTTFNRTGKQYLPSTLGDTVSAVAVESDGKVVVVGAADPGFEVVRLNENGSLDDSFGTGGQANFKVDTNQNDGPADEASAVAIQPDGKIVIVGWSPDSNGYIHDAFTVLRVTSDGRLDPSFGQRGDLRITFSGDSGAAQSRCNRTARLSSPDGLVFRRGQISFKRNSASHD